MYCDLRVVVAHPFQQHSYRTAIAVKNAGYLYKYVTTVYDKKWSFTHFLCKFLSGENKKRANSRKCDLLKDDEIILKYELEGLILLLLQRIDKRKTLYNKLYFHLLKKFNDTLVKYVINNQIDIVIVYDILSAEFMKKINEEYKEKPKIILDMSAPHFNYMIKEYQKDVENNEQVREELEKLLSSPLYSYRINDSMVELRYADAFLAASNFTKKSILALRNDAKIFICSYGIDDYLCINQGDINYSVNENSINIIYVGKISPLKGVHHLLNVINIMDDERIKLTLYGSYDVNSTIYKNNYKKYSFRGHLPREDLRQAYLNADILIMPSLSDGYGFVVSEALSYGTLVITSDNTGASYLVQDGYNGYIYNTFNEEQLLKIMNKVTKDTSAIEQMKRNAVKSVKGLSWENYYKQIGEAIDSFKNM